MDVFIGGVGVMVGRKEVGGRKEPVGVVEDSIVALIDGSVDGSVVGVLVASWVKVGSIVGKKDGS